MNSDLAQFQRFAKTYNTDQMIFFEYEPGESFFLIQTGRVKIFKILGKIEKTIDILYPGEFFGEMALLENAPRSASCIAIDECRVLEFNRNNFEVLMSGNPKLAYKLLLLFAKRIYTQKRRFNILTLNDDFAKISDVFVMFNEQLQLEKREQDNPERIFNTSIADIAHWAGMVIPRCHSILNKLQSPGPNKTVQRFHFGNQYS